MKIIFAMLLLFMMQSKADIRAQYINLSVRQASLQQVMTEVRKQSGYNFVFRQDVMEKAKAVTVKIENRKLEEALELILQKQEINYDIVGKSIILSPRVPQGKDNPRLMETGDLLQQKIRGRVVNTQGQPLVGATIYVLDAQGARTGRQWQSDSDGGFVLPGDNEGALLEISYLGHAAQRIRAKYDLGDVKLIAVSEEVNEVSVVVNTGYQRLPKDRSSGSFGRASVAIMKDRNYSTDILRQLDGLVPGLTVNGAPGADPVLIRGLTSINANRSPLVVVDGLPLDDISALNVQDVEDVTVLKDATAASIWGARAANGVIVITTKSGTASGKMKVEYNGYVNFQGRPDYKYNRMMSSAQFVKTAEEVFDPVTNPWATMSQDYYLMPHELVLYDRERGLLSEQETQVKLDSLGAINNRSQINDLWVRNSLLTNQFVSLSNGTERYRWYGSATYTNTVSNTVGELNDRYKLNIRQDFAPGKRVRFHLITDLSMGRNQSKRPFGTGSNYLPYQLFRDGQGNPLDLNYLKFANEDIRQLREEQTGIGLRYNPIEEYDHGYSSSRQALARTLGGLNINIWDGLSFEGLYGFVYGHDRSHSEEMEESFTTRYKAATMTAPPKQAGGEVVRYIPKEGSIYTLNNRDAQQWTVRNQLQYQKEFGDHAVSALLGQEAQEQRGISERSRLFGYNPQTLTYATVDYPALLSSEGIAGGYFGRISLSNDDRPFRQEDNQTRFVSYYGNASYAYKNRYVWNGTLRKDESNLFGKDKAAQNRAIWSVGGKWNISKEAFMTDVRAINSLSLRMTYGLSGNSPAPGTAASYDILAGEHWNEAPGGLVLEVVVPGNPGLTWESTSTRNIGVDFELFNQVLSGSLDYYDKKTTGLIGIYPVNMLTGQSSTTGNLGDMDNKGFEMALNSRNISTPDFSWNTMLVMSYNKNKLIRIEDNGTSSTAMFRAGYPTYAVFAYNYQGLNELGDPIIQLANGERTSDRVPTTVDDVVFKGTTQPVWNGGFSNRIRYKQFGFDVHAVYNFGHVFRRPVVIPFSSARFTTNIPVEFENRWKNPGDERHTDIPSHVPSNSINSSRRNVDYYRMGTSNVLNASFVKIRDIGFSYELPQELITKAKMEKISFRAQMHNVMLWKANKAHIDPEIMGGTPTNRNTVSIALRANF
ncbi:SusC/RagA family TonB-linked outer membrane protein [Sphingobacterium faecale]|uniref:SusC/RagA family TonB-linked outer membrane protein n=1 Tax=Sphingobacterium faecale TaxID=2803775 RepID=A0ABS1R812_9SPHI|nr:SusC/RagA family TonB-linked outer membrane protein [Sphingobacterium faecale]MBL1410828.1 SusC/RagA family TonB-linked outer membrane protein [Sphingobacterium faecale]